MCPLSSDPAPLAKHRCAWGDSGCQRLSWISRTYPLKSNQIPIDLAHWRCAFLASRLASISFPIAAAFSPALLLGTDPHKGWRQPPLLGAGGADVAVDLIPGYARLAELHLLGRGVHPGGTLLEPAPGPDIAVSLHHTEVYVYGTPSVAHLPQRGNVPQIGAFHTPRLRNSRDAPAE